MFYNFEKIVLTAARQKFSNMVQKPDIQFDEKKYQEERYFLILRLRFFTVLSVILALILKKMPAGELKTTIAVLTAMSFYIGMFGAFIKLQWNERKMKRLRRGVKRWYAWAKFAEGVKYVCISITKGIRTRRRANAKKLELAECAVANISDMKNIRKDVSEIKDVCQAESIKKDDKILQQEEEILEAKTRITEWQYEISRKEREIALLRQNIQDTDDRLHLLAAQNEQLQLRAEAAEINRGRKADKDIYSLFTDSLPRKSVDSILEFLRDIQEEDKYLTDGYAKRLVLYFCAMSRLRYIEENMSVYARYFFPYSGKSSETSYIKTFNNAKAPILSSSEFDAAIEKIRNIAES